MTKTNTILFRESGRLGNQLFQYGALRALPLTNKRLILIKFADLQAIFTNLEATFINSNNQGLTARYYRRLYKHRDVLLRRRICSSIRETYDQGEHKIQLQRGLKSNLHIVEKGYFQGEVFFADKQMRALTIRDSLLQEAREVLATIPGQAAPIFVQVRRGDYLSWPTEEYPAVLPREYYLNCMELVRQRVSEPFFIILSDDPHYVRSVFGNRRDVLISDKNAQVDFALMSLCQGGILSASSFAWWGAYFSHANYSHGCYLAPKFWVRHRERRWDSRSIIASFMDYYDLAAHSSPAA